MGNTLFLATIRGILQKLRRLVDGDLLYYTGPVLTYLINYRFY